MHISFKDFIKEDVEIRVASIGEDGINLSELATRNEINENLETVLSSGFTNPYIGLMKVRMLFQMYEMALPNVVFRNLLEGEEVVSLKSGNSEHYLHFDYSFNVEDGSCYDVTARLVTEEELDKILSAEEPND
jgi:hypothetical protein